MSITTFFTRKTVLYLIWGSLAALVLNIVVATIARNSGASPDFLPLGVALYVPATFVGIFAGWIGWRIIDIKVKNSRKLLAVLVPVLTIASLLPDTILLITKFIPYTSAPGVFGLMAMHFVVVGCGVPAYIRASKELNQSK